MSNSQSILMNGNSIYFFDNYLNSGSYMFLINAPFNTQMLVSPVNPIPGLKFIDKDPTPNIFNANLIVPQDGQYGFKVTLDRPVTQGSLEVKIIKQEGSSSIGGAKVKLWNRVDIRDCITSYFRSRNLNEWGNPNTPGATQSTPGAYMSGNFENRFEYLLSSLTIRKAVLAKLPQYKDEMSQEYGAIYY